MGRVATLVKSPGDRVFGVGYEFRIDKIELLFEYLNFREKCGYSLNEINFEPLAGQEISSTQPLACVCYYANEENFYFSPQKDQKLLARQIYESVGPSGTNREYLFNLCKSLRMIANQFDQKDILANDRHLFELESAVKDIEINPNDS